MARKKSTKKVVPLKSAKVKEAGNGAKAEIVEKPQGPSSEQQFMQVAQTFLRRCDLKGEEVDAYAKVFNFINTIVEGQVVVVPAQVWKELNDRVAKYEGGQGEDS